MLDKIKQFIVKMNVVGLYIPLLRDPKSGPSVSLTMMFIAFNVVLVGLVGKIAKQIDLDLTQAIYFYGVTAALYFGRKVTGNSKNVEISSESESK